MPNRPEQLLQGGFYNLNMSHFYCEKISSAQALQIWKNSPQSTVFTHPDVIADLADNVEWWICRKGEEPLCAWPICLNDSNEVILPDFTYYVGPLWTENAYKMPPHRWLSTTTKVYEGFIEVFIDHYKGFISSFHSDLTDVRVFDWWNYHEIDKPRCIISPRYTTVIDNISQKSELEIFNSFRELRKREIRKAERQNFSLDQNIPSSEKVIKLYQEVLARQNIIPQPQTLKLIEKLLEIIKKGFGVALSVEKNEKLAALVILLNDRNTANMTLNLVSDDFRGSGLPAWMIFNSICFARQNGLGRFDFNGANSPRRGDDKHSYGSAYSLFFQIKLCTKTKN